MRDPTVELIEVPICYDPFDASIGYAYLKKEWRKCHCPYDEFAGCSERELRILTEELRKRNRVQYGKEQVEITQRQLAAFRRECESDQVVLRQQRNDRETRLALKVLEGRRSRSDADNVIDIADASELRLKLLNIVLLQSSQGLLLLKMALIVAS